MKLHTRSLAVLLSLLLLAPAFVACAETEKPDEEQTAATTAPAEDTAAAEEPEAVFIPDDLETADFDGYGFNILSCEVVNKEGAHVVMYEEITGDPVNDKLFDSKCAVEERFNVTIGMIDEATSASAETTFRTSVNGGDHAFDILVGHDQGTTKLGKEGVCLNLLSIPQFNFEKPWWPKHAVESLTLGGKLYTASSYLSYLGLHWTRAICVNKVMAENLSIDIPYDMVREGKWTLDALHTIIEGIGYDTDGNGKVDFRDQIGLASGDQTWYCLQEDVMASPYKRDDAGVPYFDANVERIQKYEEIMSDIINSDDYAEEGMFGSKIFEQGNALMAYTQLGDAYDIFRMTDVKYGFLPSPKFDELQEDYINCCTDMPWCVPKTTTDELAAVIGSVVEALSCQNYNYVLPVYFEGAIKARIADAPDDSEMLALIADTRTISFPFTYALPAYNIVYDCVIGNRETASYIKSIQKIATRQLEKLVEKYENME